MVNPIINTFFRDNQQHISQYNVQSYDHFFKNNFIQLIRLLNEKSKIIKEYKVQNYRLEVQTFIGDEDVNRLYIIPPQTTWEDSELPQTHGGKLDDDDNNDDENECDTLKHDSNPIQHLNQDNHDDNKSVDIQDSLEKQIVGGHKIQDQTPKQTQEVHIMNSLDIKQKPGNLKNQALNNVQKKLKKHKDNEVQYDIENKKGIHDIIKDNFKSIQQDKVQFSKSEKGRIPFASQKKKKYLYPNEARLKNLSYQSKLMADIVVKYKFFSTQNGKNILLDTKEDIFQNETLGYLPIMLKSCLCALKNKNTDFLKYVGECPFDQGGYFIIDGQEKVIIAQERFALNKLFVQILKNDNKVHQCAGLIRSTSRQDEFFPKTIHFKQFRNERSSRRNAIVVQMKFDGGIQQSTEIDIPLFVMFRALNVENDLDIQRMINPQQDTQVDNVLYFCRRDNHHVYDQQQAFKFILSLVNGLTIEGIQGSLVYNLFPNLEYSFYNKALFLGKIMSKFIRTSVGQIQQTDKDSMYVKRVDAGGQLYENMIRDLFNTYRDIGRSNFDNILNTSGFMQFNKIVQLLNVNSFKTTFPQDIIQSNIQAQMKGKYGQIIIMSKSKQQLNTKERVILKKARDGVVQDLSRTSYLLYIDMLRKVVNYQESDDIKLIGPHLLHLSQIGYFCPSDSQDGINLGVHKYISVLAQISQNISSKGAFELCQDINGMIKMEDCTREQIDDKINIYVNSMFYGVYDGPMNISQLLYYMTLIKRNGLINITTSISCNYELNEINVLSESGRMIRPLIILKNNEHAFTQDMVRQLNKQQITWQDLIYGNTYKIIDDKHKFNLQERLFMSYYISPKEVFKTDDILQLVKFMEQGSCCIEYLDYEMSENALIAIDESKLQNNEMQLHKFLGNQAKDLKQTVEDDYYLFTHLEIDPSALLSPVQNHTPFLSHNPSTRNLLSCQQTKHSIGIPYTNFNNRLDTQSYILHNPQRPLCSSIYQTYYNTNSLGFGFNTFVVIMCYTGQNQEDSIIFNKASVERGMFDITSYKSFSDAEERDPNKKIVVSFQKDHSIQEELNKTDENGFPIVGTVLDNEHTVLLSKISKIVEKTLQKGEIVINVKEKVHEHFINKQAKNKYIGFTVDKVFVFLNQTGDNEVKVRLRQFRQMQPGDKAGSRQAQKGVVGSIMNPQDMPYSQDGQIPDLIITPTAIPTRMTIAYFLETGLSQIALNNGTFMDSTAFHDDKDTLSNISKTLNQMGMHSGCQKIFYNGFDGTQMKGNVLYAPMFYMKLKQQAMDKINARPGTGKLDQATRQPTGGRANEGGLRLSEMEINSLLAHGINNFMKESLIFKSDFFLLQLCNDCGRLVNNKAMCDQCKGSNIFPFDTGFSFKQFLQELNQMHIKCRFLVEGNEDFHD